MPYVIPTGQEDRIRRMIAPAAGLPPGWAFLHAEMGSEIRALYRHAAERLTAQVTLSHPATAAPGRATRRFVLHLKASRATPTARALFDAIVAEVQRHEAEFAWAPVAEPDRADDGDFLRSPFGRSVLSAMLGELGPDLPAPSNASAFASEPDSAARLLHAVGHSLAGARQSARAAALRAVEGTPGSLRTALAAAVVLFAQRDYTPALCVLNGFLAQSPSPVDELTAHAAKFEILRRAGWFRDALTAVDTALARFPDSAVLHRAAAELCGTLHVPERARDHMRKALAHTPAPVPFLLSFRAARMFVALGDEAEAGATLDAALAQSEALPQTFLMYAATLYTKIGAFDAAARIHTRVLDDRPRAVECHLALAELAVWRGDVTETRRLVEAALRIDEASAAAHRLAGAAHMLRRDHDHALVEFDTAIRLDPADAEAHVWRGEALLCAGSAKAALAAINHGGELTDNLSDYVAGQILRTLAQLRGGKFPGLPDHVLPQVLAALGEATSATETDAALEAALESALTKLQGNRSPSNPTYVGGGGTELRRIRVQPSPREPSKEALLRFVATASIAEGLEAFEEIHRNYPGVPEPYNYRGEMYLYVGDYAEARRNFEKALSLYERSKWAFIGLGGVAVLEGRDEEALDFIQRGIELGGGPGPTSFVYRGEANRKLGRLDAARSDLEHAVKLNPLRVGAWVNLGLLRCALGDGPGLTDVFTWLKDRAPGLLEDAADETGLAVWEPQELTLASAPPFLEHLLTMLRGNRASACVTYFTANGSLRTVPPTGPASVDVARWPERLQGEILAEIGD